MRLRPLLRADIPRVLEICGQVFSGDELFRYLYPHQAEYPRDLARYQLIRLRARLVQRGGHAVVAETEPRDEFEGGAPRVVGFGFFVREGVDANARRWRREGWFGRVERYLLSWDEWYEAKFLQRALDREAEAVFANAAKYEFYDVLEDYWLLGLLGVDPKCQRRGIGQKIVDYGLKMAEEEGVPVTLEASVMGRKLYQKIGFKTIQKTKIVTGRDDQVDLEEGVAMLFEPPGLKGKWLEERDDGTVKLKVCDGQS